MPGKKKQQVHITPLNTKAMRVEADGEWIVVGGQRFKRTVLPSVAEQSDNNEVGTEVEDLTVETEDQDEE